MIWGISPSHVRIVESWSGPGTAETVYRDENGRIWRQDYGFTASATVPPLRGTLCNGFIKIGG